MLSMPMRISPTGRIRQKEVTRCRYGFVQVSGLCTFLVIGLATCFVLMPNDVNVSSGYRNYGTVSVVYKSVYDKKGHKIVLSFVPGPDPYPTFC